MMNRLTTDAPKDNLENALNQFYIKDKETWVRRYGPPPEYPDISLDDLMRRLIAELLPEVECPKDPQAFSWMMTEWLFDDMDAMEGVFALLYSAAWAFAELRQRLKAYEDTGLTPEGIKELKRGYRYQYESLTFLLRETDCEVSHVRELLTAEKEGRLEVLPCKVGNLVWGIRQHTTMRKGTRRTPVQAPVHEMFFGEDMRLCIVLKGICRGEWGKVVFATEEDAWAAILGGCDS